SCRYKCYRLGPSPAPANTEFRGAGQRLWGRAPASIAKPYREVTREPPWCRGPLCAQRKHSNLGFGRRKDLFAVLDFVVNRLRGGEKRFVRPLAEQVVGDIQLMEHITGSRARLNLHVSNLAGSGHNDRKFLHMFLL